MDSGKVLELDYETIKGLDVSKYLEYRVNPVEFFGLPGKEHYRTLAYLSTLYDGADIVDIGTHMGSSALALSYNPNNTVHTFDIVDKLDISIGSPKMARNIKFYVEDLCNPEVLESHLDMLMNSPLIFMDIDPHEGGRELEFYRFLRDQGYKGLVVFDDIDHFPGMRNFWNNVEERHKYDITNFGHWSGTGIVSFEPLTLKTTISH